MTGTIAKAAVLKLAQKKRGKTAQLRHNPKAPDAAQKEVLREQAKQRNSRKKQLEEERKALGDTRTPLRQAVRFAVDVGGDEPSWTQLREALEREERYAALTEEIRELEQAGRKAPHGFSYRWEVIVIVNIAGMAMCECHEGADTLEELAAKLSQ